MKRNIGLVLCTLTNIIISITLCVLSNMVVGKLWWKIFTVILTTVVVCEDLKDLYKLINYNK